MRQRGTTLLEVVLAAAIALTIAAAFFSLARGSRALGMRSALSQFDAALAYARALAAASGNGATLVFQRRTSADGTALPGFKLIVYSGRPAYAGALRSSSLPPIESGADVAETRLGSVPFTIFLNGAGHASAMSGAVSTGAEPASDPGCPAGESSVVLTFSDAHGSQLRSLPCDAAVGGTPVTFPAP
jgi:type II secretory pathway pseudopilin PulG